MATKTDTFVVDPRQVRNLLFRIIAFLVVLGAAASLSRIAAGGDLSVNDLAARFELDTENSLPAWFSSLLLLASAPPLALLALRSRGEGHTRDARAWAGLAVLMVATSLDEMASFHEHAAAVLGIEVAGFHGAYNWVVVGFAFVIVLGLVYARFVWRLAAELRRGLILGAGVFFGGAVGIETFNAYSVSSAGTDATYRYVLGTAVEEGMEMMGATLILYALLAYLQRNDWSVTFHFRESAAADGSHPPSPPTAGEATSPSDKLP